jgi:hypothetical protein
MRMVPLDVVGADGRFGNPFLMQGRSEVARARSILAFAEWVGGSEPGAVLLRDSLWLLRDRTLVCWCSPKHCHAEVLAVLVEGGSWAQARELAVRIAEDLDPGALFDQPGLFD